MKNYGTTLNDIKPSFIEVKSKEYRETMQMLGFKADNIVYTVAKEDPEYSEKEDNDTKKVRGIQINHGKSVLTKTENDLAKWLHDQYEDIAKAKNWDTQKDCKVEFKDLPEANKQTMIELAKRILSHGDF